MRLLKKKWKLMMMEKEQEVQKRKHVRMNLEMNHHHHHDHEKSIRPGVEAVRLHNLTHCPYQSWCEVCVASKGKSDHYHREAPQPMDGDVARIQMDFMFIGEKEHSWMNRERRRQFS